MKITTPKITEFEMAYYHVFGVKLQDDNSFLEYFYIDTEFLDELIKNTLDYCKCHSHPTLTDTAMKSIINLVKTVQRKKQML